MPECVRPSWPLSLSSAIFSCRVKSVLLSARTSCHKVRNDRLEYVLLPEAPQCKYEPTAPGTRALHRETSARRHPPERIFSRDYLQLTSADGSDAFAAASAGILPMRHFRPGRCACRHARAGRRVVSLRGSDRRRHRRCPRRYVPESSLTPHTHTRRLRWCANGWPALEDPLAALVPRHTTPPSDHPPPRIAPALLPSPIPTTATCHPTAPIPLHHNLPFAPFLHARRRILPPADPTTTPFPTTSRRLQPLLPPRRSLPRPRAAPHTRQLGAVRRRRHHRPPRQELLK